MDEEQKEQATKEFLEAIEDDCTYDQIFDDGINILAIIDKEI